MRFPSSVSRPVVLFRYNRPDYDADDAGVGATKRLRCCALQAERARLIDRKILNPLCIVALVRLRASPFNVSDRFNKLHATANICKAAQIAATCDSRAIKPQSLHFKTDVRRPLAAVPNFHEMT